MNAILIDTNAYAAFKRGRSDALLVVQRAPFIGISSIVVGELLGGFAAGTRKAENRRELEAFLASPRVAFHPVERVTAERYAEIYASLKTAGTPIPTNDIWIAASAIERGLSLFTFDAHFRHVPGLKVGASEAELSIP